MTAWKLSQQSSVSKGSKYTNLAVYTFLFTIQCLTISMAVMYFTLIKVKCVTAMDIVIICLSWQIMLLTKRGNTYICTITLNSNNNNKYLHNIINICKRIINALCT